MAVTQESYFQKVPYEGLLFGALEYKPPKNGMP